MYFVLLVIEKFTGLHKKSGTLLNIFKWLYTILFVVLGWVIFRSDSIEEAFVYIRSMFGLMGNTFTDGMFNGWFIQNMFLLIIGVILSTPLFRFLSQKTKDSNVIGFIKVGGLICLFVLSVASLVSSSYNPFIYFNF